MNPIHSNTLNTSNSGKGIGIGTGHGSIGLERRRSHNESTFEMIRRGSFSADTLLSTFTSMEIPDMKELLPQQSIDEDVENSMNNITNSNNNEIPTRKMTEDEIDDEQLDMCVNEILGGIADMEEITNPENL